MAGRLRRQSLLLIFTILLPGCAWSRRAESVSLIEAQSLIAEARQAEEGGQRDRAIRLLLQAAEANPQDVSIHRKLAELQLAEGEVTAAVERLRFATSKAPEDAEGFVELARVLLRLKRDESAQEALGRALALEPEHVEALLLLGDLQERSGDREQALATYHRVLGVESGHIEAKLRIALLQMHSGRYDRAAPALRSICQCPTADDAQKGAAYWSLGIDYGRQGRWRDAAELLARSAALRKTLPADDWYRLAYARMQAGAPEGALKDLEQALGANPDHAAARGMAAALGSQTVPSPGGIAPIDGVAGKIVAPMGW